MSAPAKESGHDGRPRRVMLGVAVPPFQDESWGEHPVPVDIPALLDALGDAYRDEARAAARRSALLADLLQRALDAAEDRATTRELVVRSCAAEAAMALRLSPSAMQRRLHDAWTIAIRFPATQSVWSSGDIGERHALVIARHGAAIEDDDVRALYETELLEHVPEVTARQLERIAERLAAEVGELSFDERYERARRERHVRVTDEGDGMSTLRAHLPSFLAHAIADRLTQQAKAIREVSVREEAGRRAARRSGAWADGAAGRPEASGRQGDALTAHDPAGLADPAGSAGSADSAGCADPAGSAGLAGSAGPADPVAPADLERSADATRPDDRSLDEIRADLLADLVLGGDSRQIADALGEDAPRIVARIDIEVPALSLAGKSEEPAELLGVGPIPREQALEAFGERPELFRLVTDPVTKLPLASEQRLAWAALRRTLIARDQTCRIPGCRRPAGRCDVDHTIPWIDGGATEPDNLAHLCRGHHTMKHEAGWRVRQLGGGVLEWISPNGRVSWDQPARSRVAFVRRIFEEEASHQAGRRDSTESDFEPPRSGRPEPPLPSGPESPPWSPSPPSSWSPSRSESPSHRPEPVPAPF